MGLDAQTGLAFLTGLTRGGVAYRSQLRQQDEQDAERQRQGIEAVIEAALSSPNLRPEAVPHLIAMGISAHGAKPKDVENVRRGLMNLVGGGVDVPGLEVTGTDEGGPIRVNAQSIYGLTGQTPPAQTAPAPSQGTQAGDDPTRGYGPFTPTTPANVRASTRRVARPLPATVAQPGASPVALPDQPTPDELVTPGVGGAPVAKVGTVKRPLYLSPEEARANKAADITSATEAQLKARLPYDLAKIDEQNRLKDEFREKQGVLRMLQFKRGQKIDPNNPADAYLLERAETAGFPINVESWNNSGSNLYSTELTSPTDPTKKIRVLVNKVTGAQTIEGDSGFQQPVDSATGMTAKQGADVKLGGERLGETKRHNQVTEAQGEARIGLQQKGFDLRQAVQDQHTTERGRKELAEAYKLAAQSEMYARAAQDLENKTTYKDPDSGEVRESKKWAAKRDEYLSRAAAQRSQFVNTYGYLFAPSDDAPPQMTLNQFRGLFPNAAGSPAVEASRLGITLSDTDQGVRGPASPMPRRGAPARSAQPARATAPSDGKTHVSRAAARAKYPELKDKSDAEVDAAIRSAGFEPMP